MRVVKLTVFQLRQSVNVNIVFSSYIFWLGMYEWSISLAGDNNGTGKEILYIWIFAVI